MAKTKRVRKKIADKKLQSGFKAKEKQNVINPFEIHLNKRKHKILGQKLKNDKGMPGVSRAKSQKKRKETLLREFMVRNKSNAFIDRRIGEKNKSLSVEDKMNVRFATERKKQHGKADIYNLNEDEDLTHYGQSLSEIEKFDDPRSDNEDEEAHLGANFVDAHFGGLLTKKDEGSDDKSKTRAEIIDEMIVNSKKKKHEMKAEREATLDLTDKLDARWQEINSLMTSLKRRPDETDLTKADDFDIKVRELKFETRGKASDKLKTADEIAKEEKEKLEKLEQERILRMKGLSSQEVSESKHKSADDLDDGFVLDADDNFEVCYDQDGNMIGGGSASTSEDEKQPKDDSDASEEDDDEDDYSDLKSEDGHGDKDTVDSSTVRTNSIKDDLLKRKKVMDAARKELPYTYSVPENIEEFMTLVSGQPVEQQSIIVERIIKCNHPSLNGDNKAKLENLFTILLQYLFGKLTDEDGSTESVSLFDQMTQYLYELNQFSPEINGKAMIDVVLGKQQEFERLCKKQAKVPFPHFSTICLLRILPLLYSASDFNHPVITPSLIFISQILTRCSILTFQDVIYGLYVCDICRQYVALSERYLPEVINFLRGTLFISFKSDSKKDVSVILPFKSSGDSSCLLVPLSTEINDEKLSDLVQVPKHSDIVPDELKSQITKHCLQITNYYVNIYKQLPSFQEIISPIHKLCKVLADNHPSKLIKKLCLDIISEYEDKRQLEPLVWPHRKPPSLKMLEPRIQENFDGKKERKGNKSYVEKQKLTHKYKQEMKGAMREIRKDGQFLARQQLQDQLQKDDERKRKVKKLYSDLANQEGDYNAMKRKKGK